MKMKNWVLGAFVCTLGLAGSISESRAEAPAIIKAAGEVFLKGSIDGKSMFLVLGMEDGFKATKDIAEWAVKGSDLVALGHDIYNSEHSGDFVDAVSSGARTAKEWFPKILSQPWKSVEKIPTSFRVNMDQADASYYNSKNAAVGTLKYGGWAVWSVVQGAYYLVIEAPVEMVGYTLGTIGAIPGSFALQGLVIAWDVTKILFKYTTGIISAALVNTYAFITSTTATALTLAAGGAVAIMKGSKWLVYDMPRMYFYPINTSYLTQFALEKQEQVAQAVAEYFEKIGHFVVEKTIGKYKSEVRVLSKSETEKMTYALFHIYPEKGVVSIQTEVSRQYVNMRVAEKTSLTKSEVKMQIAAELIGVLQTIEGKMTPAPEQPAVVISVPLAS